MRSPQACRTLVRALCGLAAAAAAPPAVAGGGPDAGPAATTRPAATLPAPDAAAVDALAGRLADPDWRARERALAELIRMGDPAVAPLERLAADTPVDEVRTAARTALKQIAENRVVGPSYVTLRLADVPARQAVEALERQAYVPLKPFPDDLWAEMPAARVTLDVDRVPFWAAMREVARQTGLDFAEMNGQVRLIQAGGPTRLAGRHAAVAGAFMVVATQSTLNRSVNYEAADDPPVQEDFSLQLTAFAEPKLRVLRVSPSPAVQEAVDEAGRSLLPPAEPGAADAAAAEGMDYGGGGGDGSYSLFVPLHRPKEAGRRIARLRGTIGFRVQLESQVIELKDLRSLKDAARMANGVRVVFNDLKREQDLHLLRVTVHADPANPALLAELQAGLTQRLRLLDAKGRPLEGHGVNNVNTAENRVELTLTFAAGQAPNGEKAAGDPARLVWEFPTKTRDLTVPFELKDLKLP